MKNKYNFWIIILIICQLSIINCQLSIAQFNFIGRKINPSQPKPIPSIPLKSGTTIPSLEFKFDSIRPLTELKTGNGETYPWLSPDGNRIYYSEGTVALSQIYMAEKQTGQSKFSNPHPLSINNSDSSTWNDSPWLTNDELNIYFIRATIHGKIYLCHSTRDSINQNFSTPTHVNLIGKNIINIEGPSFTQDLETLYMDNSNDAATNTKIYIFNKTAIDEYILSDTLQIPNNYSIGQGTLTSDDLNYFLSFSRFVQFSFLYVFKRDSVNEKFTKLYYVNNPYINDTNYIGTGGIGCPYFSISNNILAFVRAKDSVTGAGGNSVVIYFAYNFRQFDNIEENKNILNYIKIFPNPTDNYVELLSAKLQQSFDYYLTNLAGQIIKSGTFSNNIKLDLSSFSKGVYILTIINQNKNQKAFYKIMKI